jgi:DNA-binding NtrC family response regulator
MRILLTGFMDMKAIVDSINEGEVYRFINKPWRNDEMREVVADAALASEIPVMPMDETISNSDQKVASGDGDTQQPKPVKSLADQALLMMEKKKDIRTQIRKFCSDKEIMIYATQNVEQAVAAATSRDSIGVAVIELSEDTQSTLQTINLLKQARPELITIALTDEFDAHTAVDLINQGQVYKYLAKPLDISVFQNTINNAFIRHLYLKNNSQATQRFKVESPREKIVSSLQSFFGKLINASS